MVILTINNKDITMAYLRFLTNKDYNAIATEEHMAQLIRDVPERIPQAEQRAEMQVLEYLDQYYEIRKVLAVGKNIRDYNPMVSYPGQVWIKKDGDIYKTLRYINGQKKPVKEAYWKQVVDFIAPELIDHAKKYSQLRMYARGEVVRFGTEYWVCTIPHGYEAGDIQVPGIKPWVETEVTPWSPNMEWAKDQVCSFNDKFYQYLYEPSTEEGEEGEGAEPTQPSDPSLTPEDDDNWGLIGDYSTDLEYDYTEGVKDYVVYDGAVFYPVLNPNPDKLVEGENITLDDPRNQSIVSHLSRIALYHLHSIISPTNISETRRWAYEDSIQWLYNASKFKINPQLPRKKEKDTDDPLVDWACETFQRDYNPNENPWLI